RSSSPSGSPAPSFRRFVGGCRSSASRNGEPARSAIARATVVFPAPETPMTTMCGEGKGDRRSDGEGQRPEYRAAQGLVAAVPHTAARFGGDPAGRRADEGRGVE